MSAEKQIATRPPGRPRSAEADAAIVRATLQALLEDGYRGLSMERVRTLAGVGKATLYRRYASKAELAKAAVGHLHAGLSAPEDTGSFRGDLAAFQIAAIAAAKAVGAPLFLPRLLTDAAEDPELHAIFRAALVEPRRAAARTIIERAIDRGEVRADLDPDALIDLLAAPYLYRLVIDGGHVEAAFARSAAWLDVILLGATPRG